MNGADSAAGDDDLDPDWKLETEGYLLFVGRLVPEKAPDLLLESFRRMPGQLKLVLAGGESFTAGFASTLIEQSRLDARVVMPGYVFGRQLASLYRNARLFVLPSLLEGLPLTLLEAVSFGLPVVASDIPPHLEVLGADGPGHRIFRAGDGDDLASALRRSLVDPAAERAGARELQARVRAAYDWDLAVSELEALYRRLTAGRR